MFSRIVLFAIGLASVLVLFTLLSVLLFLWGENSLWFATGLGKYFKIFIK